MTDQLPEPNPPKYTHSSFALGSDEPKPKFVYFSFAVLDIGSEPTDPIKQVAIVSGSVLGETAEAIALIKSAIAEWLATEEGFEVLDEVQGIFTFFELEDFYTAQLEDILFKHGIIDLQIDIETEVVTTELNLLN